MSHLYAFVWCLLLWGVAEQRTLASGSPFHKDSIKVTELGFAFSGNVVAELEQNGKKKVITFATNFALDDKPPPDPGKINVLIQENGVPGRTRWLSKDSKETTVLLKLLAERLTVTSDALERRRITTIQQWLRNRDNRLPSRREGKKFGISWIGD